MQKKHGDLVSEIKAKLAKVKYIAITSDIWSRGTRSFIAVNAHWLNRKGKLETALIACDRFRGHHSADEIANKLKAILSKYDILSKVVAITTDNARNFKSCLQKHGEDYETINELMTNTLDEDADMLFQLDLDDLSNMWCPSEELILNPATDIVPLTANANANDNYNSSDDDDDEAATRNQTDGFQVQKMPDEIIGRVVENTENVVLLPNRIDCGAHSLNLVGKVDAFDALNSNSEYSRQYVSVFTKLNEIWRVNSTRLGRETFQLYMNKKSILKPHRIRWNRIYDAVSVLNFNFVLRKCSTKQPFTFHIQIGNILSLDWAGLATACEALKIDKLCDQDIDFLKEYKLVLQPIAEAITFVEGSMNTFGSYLPTLFGIRTRLRELHLNSDELKYCKPLLDAIRSGFNTRFAHLMHLPDMYVQGDPKAAPLFIAMLSNPRYKTNFIPPYWFDENPLGFNQIKNLMINTMKQLVDLQKRQLQEAQQQQQPQQSTSSNSNGNLVGNADQLNPGPEQTSASKCKCYQISVKFGLIDLLRLRLVACFYFVFAAYFALYSELTLYIQ